MTLEQERRIDEVIPDVPLRMKVKLDVDLPINGVTIRHWRMGKKEFLAENWV